MKPSRAIPYLSTIEIQRRGFEVLCRTMGVADAIRFIRAFDLGSGDYSAEKKKLLRRITAEQALAEALAVPEGPVRPRRPGRR